MLSLRLQTIQSLIEPDKVVADIGTDHALLPVELVVSKQIQKAYAIDNKVGPFQRAKQYVREKNLEQSITVLLGDGLSVVPIDADCWIIAGMGYDTAAMILDQRSTIPVGQQVIIQVNHGVDRMRKYLGEHSWQILDEKIIFEDHFYQIIKAEKMKSVIRMKFEDITFGPMLRKEKNSTFVEYWIAQQEKLQKIVDQLDRKSKRALELSKQISAIQHMLNG